jgi:hypothetical protein
MAVQNLSKCTRILAILLICSIGLRAQHHGSNSGSRPYYGGGHHTESHGGHYQGATNSHHKGGHYVNPRTSDHYGRQK